MALTKNQKTKQLSKHPECYVCKGLNLAHANFKGYDKTEIQYDHYRAQSLVGDNQKDLVANQFPIHCAKDGDDYKSLNYSKSTKRNCHNGKFNKYNGEEWVDFVRIYRQALTIEYSDDLFKDRKATNKQFQVDIKWDEKAGYVEFNGTKYPIMEQNVGDDSWVSFGTVVKPSLLWVDQEVQTRPANKKRITDLAWHLRDNPLLSPLLCRYSDSKLKVFDGNHRLCAFILARQHHPVPVVIFRGPDPGKFLEVVAEAHDKLTQKKYQYSDKALKFSGVSESELEEVVLAHGDEASEQKAWNDLTKAQVKVRLIGRVLEDFENRKKNWRHAWTKTRLTDASFTWMINYYSHTEALAVPFKSEDNIRDSEIKNLFTLFDIFDRELFKKLNKYRNAEASLKTKWWKAAHQRFRTGFSQIVKTTFKLKNTPEKPAYTKEWDDYIKSQLNSAVRQWITSPVWAGDTTANNEPDVKAVLSDGEFTESYLFQ